MSIRKRAAVATAAVALTLISIGTSAGIAQAADEGTPADVRAQFGEAAIASIHESQASFDQLEGNTTDLTKATSFGTIFRITQWSTDFVYGRSSENPVIELDEWLAPVIDESGAAIGTYRVWRPTPGAPAEYAGLNGNEDTAAALNKLNPSAVLIEDPMSSGWFAMEEGKIFALTDVAAMEAPKPVSPEELMPVVSKRVLATIENSAGLDGAAGGGGPLGDLRAQDGELIPGVILSLSVAGAGVLGLVIVLLRMRKSRGIRPEKS